jgi:hypothetical protein
MWEHKACPEWEIGLNVHFLIVKGFMSWFTGSSLCAARKDTISQTIPVHVRICALSPHSSYVGGGNLPYLVDLPYLVKKIPFLIPIAIIGNGVANDRSYEEIWSRIA